MSKATDMDCGGKRSATPLSHALKTSESGVVASLCHRTPKASRAVSRVLAVIAGALLLFSLKFPLWQMRLEAPQYRDEEALQIAVHPNSFRGDLKELTVLNQYIGVHVPPTLPQFKWLPGALIAGAVLSMAASFLRSDTRRRTLTLVNCALTAALALAAVQAMSQMHDIGHKRDQKTVLVGVKDFTPPFLGTTKIAQFTVRSRFGPGAWRLAARWCCNLARRG